MIAQAWAVVGGDTSAKSLRGQELQRFEAQRVAMGVLFKIVGYASSETQARDAAEAAFGRIEELNAIFSDYDPESEARRLTLDQRPETWLGVSPEMYFVLKRAKEINSRSGQAFDITVGPLSKLWREVRRQRELPVEQTLAQAQAKVSMEHLEIHPTDHRVRIRVPEVRLDFGGIAKGYAADEALRVLAAHGIDSALIDASGDVSFSNPPPDRESWYAQVAPLQKDGPPARRLALRQMAVATSGDAWQFVELEGKRFSHIIDPRTGWAIQGRQSVSVIAPSGLEADAWASALSVVGIEEGLTLVEELPGVEALFVVVQGEEVLMRESSGFSRFDAPAPEGDR